MAKPLPSKLADAYQTYPTASAAAVAALRGITNTEVESGGGILYNKAQNTYAATEPVGQNKGDHFAAAVSVPQGWQLHSTYHTHPAGPRSNAFSEDDVATANQLKAPSYILSLADNKVRVFDPASSQVLKDPSGGSLLNGRRFSNGSIVDETPPTTSPAASALPIPPPTTPATATQPSPSPVPPAATLPAATVPIDGSRITMKDFAARHRAQTTKYRHKIVHIKLTHYFPSG
jgi:hypothetical protein